LNEPAVGVRRALLETIGFIRQSLNPRLDIAGLLLTMFDTRNGLAHQVVNEVRQHFPSQVFQTVIPRNVRLSESPSPEQHNVETWPGRSCRADVSTPPSRCS